MKDIVSRLTLRGALSFLVPSAYLLALMVVLAQSCELLILYTSDWLWIFISVLVLALVVHVLNVPEALCFYRCADPTSRVAKYLCTMYPQMRCCNQRIVRAQVENQYFQHFDAHATGEIRNRTHKFVHLYSIAVDIAFISFLFLPISLLAYYFYGSDFFTEYGVWLVVVLLLSAFCAYGLFYFRGGVKHLFERQTREFKSSTEFAALDEYCKEKFGAYKPTIFED